MNKSTLMLVTARPQFNIKSNALPTPSRDVGEKLTISHHKIKKQVSSNRVSPRRDCAYEDNQSVHESTSSSQKGNRLIRLSLEEMITKSLINKFVNTNPFFSEQVTSQSQLPLIDSKPYQEGDS
jgi:hypothetical protein